MGQPNKALERWIIAIARQARQAASHRFHGSLRVVFHDGAITRVVLESSHVDPDSLAPSDDATVGSPSTASVEARSSGT